MTPAILDGEIALSLSYRAPCCGTVFRLDRSQLDGDPVGFAHLNCCEMAEWLRDRLARHECALVSADNQMGLRKPAAFEV